MKKTLIALMALAGVAMANEGAITLDETTITASFTVAPVNVGNCYSGDYTFQFTLNEQYTIADSGSVLGFYRGNAVNDGYGYNGFVLSETNGVLTLTLGRGRANNTLAEGTGIGANTTFAFGTDASATNSVVFSTAIEKGVTYTVTVKGNDGIMTPTLSWEGGEEALTSGYKSNMNGNAALTCVVNPGVALTIVPEPATATLSLLALAGLAARRRRK